MNPWLNISEGDNVVEITKILQEYLLMMQNVQDGQKLKNGLLVS
jgi:hypothetical protein